MQPPPPKEPTTFSYGEAHNETRGKYLENQRIIASATEADQAKTFGSELGGKR